MSNPRLPPTVEVLPQTPDQISLPGNVEDPAPPLHPGYQQTNKIAIPIAGHLQQRYLLF